VLEICALSYYSTPILRGHPEDLLPHPEK